MAISLVINGAEHQIDSDPATPLLYVLRDDFGLNGAKYRLRARPVRLLHGDGGWRGRAVLRYAHSGGSRAREITTVEGLGTIEEPGPMQQAFIEMQAAQCGYCIPGMMMRAQALLQKNASPTEAEIRQALTSNLCRCGTHMRILAAIRRAGELMRQASVEPERSAG